MAIELVAPTDAHLPSYVESLRRSWSPNTTRQEVADEQLAAIAEDPVAFLAGMDDRDGRLPDIVLPDGSTRRRIPGFTRWLWDGEHGGSINLRWLPGTADLPPHVLGHIGYSVVPWKRRLGYATAALALLLPEAAEVGLPYVELTTDTDNEASQKVITANGGVLVERFEQGPEFGGGELNRYRIDLRLGQAVP